jgi:hypothetical protein
VFLIAWHKRDIALPGVVLRPRKGPPPLATARPFIGDLRLASPGRAFLENMRPSRARGDEAREIAAQLNMPEEFRQWLSLEILVRKVSTPEHFNRICRGPHFR